MKSTNFLKQSLIFIIFLVSLIFGLYINENLSGGGIYDYNIHKRTIDDLFSKDLIYGFFNYDKLSNTHSPIFIILLSFIISNNEFLGRFIYILISSSVVIIFYKSLKLKYKTNSLYLFLLSNFFLLSPYYRAYSIWPGDETLSLTLFCFSIYFCLKFILSSKKKIIYIFFNVITLAAASYLRPIYCIFSIFFFFIFFLNNNFDLKKFYLYLILNLLLAFPAYYYVFILEVVFFSRYLETINFVTTITLVYLTIFFYLTPIILLDFKNIIYRFNFLNFLLTVSIYIVVLFFFNYEHTAGGGFYYRISKFLFNNDLLVYLIFPFAFYYTNQILELHNKNNLILFLLLIVMEIDGHFYMETYDPLFYVLLFSLFDTKKIRNLPTDLSKTVLVIFIFQFSLLFLKFFQLNVINTNNLL